ncbi:MAG: dihydropteroate synthase [Verrucomicrobiota bacterium]
MNWRHLNGSFKFTQSSQPLLMGILNMTPDSFSDGNSYPTAQLALDHVSRMIDEGADLVDVGGESTRPGAKPVSTQEEIKRTQVIIQKIHQKHPKTPISIDTTKATVASSAIDAGASIINDISAARWDPAMTELLASTQAGYICMHALDKPQKMQHDPHYQNVPSQILEFLSSRQKELISLTIDPERLVFDVGIGFGKTVSHNLELLRRQDCWRQLKRPMLWGLSRKSFIGKVLQTSVENRLAGSLAAHAYLLEHKQGPQIWRVHEIAEYKHLIKMWDALRLISFHG